jgi:hypothetical protein
VNDKERILMEVISGLRTAQSLAPRDAKSKEWTIGDAAYDNGSGGQYVHFAPWAGDEDLKPGELVMCQTGQIDDFKIGFIVRRVEYGRCIIREIGSDRLCDYSNEMFTPIRGLTATQLLEGEQYKFYLKVRKAFERGDEFWHRFGGVDIQDGAAVIWVRERYGGLKTPSRPFSVDVTWTPKTTIKAILEALRAGGYGTRVFEPVNAGEVNEEIT